ncbi:hypothetical protein TPSD3_16245 [Thioflexithrix psekupsensis]|uniref:Uncharacterized protein n=1 Tax=Thioflexithrix psekupsensis TaxID=1570016 RepID=A0A251X6S3_9GAMM|nr:hypothetical protein TPSD3_16245 [Thioflexithrix psekupsensis]
MNPARFIHSRGFSSEEVVKSKSMNQHGGMQKWTAAPWSDLPSQLWELEKHPLSFLSLPRQRDWGEVA